MQRPIPPEPADVSLFIGPVADTPRGREYMRVYDDAIAALLQEYDVDSGFVPQVISPGYVEAPPEVAALDRHTRKRYLSGDTHWLYRLGRNSASAVGALAQAYYQPLSRYHGDAEVLRAAKNGFELFMRNQSAEGEFVFSPLRYSSVYGTHEMAWRLEDFIVGYFAIRDSLTPDERARYWAFLNRAMRFLQATPCDHACNRGMVWLAVMSMCWRATGDETYLIDARNVWLQVHKAVFQANGQVYEGEGPDLIYSPVSYEYLLRYYIMTGDTELEETVLGATDWMTEMYTDRLAPMVGLSTRYDTPDGELNIFRLLVGYEMFSHRRPEYPALAANLLDQVSRRRSRASTDHGGISWLTAARLHDPRFIPSEPVPLEPWVHRYSQTSIHYYTVGQEGYQTMAILQSVRPKKGLQVWAVRGSDPFLFAEDPQASTLRSWGLDLRSRDVTNDDWSHNDRPAEGGAGVSNVTAAHGPLVVSYLFTPASTVVIHTLPEGGDRETVWSGSRRFIEGYRLDGDRVVAEGAEGSLQWWGDAPTLSENALQVAFRDSSSTQAYAFAAGAFTARELGTNGSVVHVTWQDDSGRYEAYVNQSRGAADAEIGGGTVRLGRGEARVMRLAE